MAKQVDEFFRGKLEEHASAPSAAAWEKIEADLVKKNKTVLIWRMAAALALLGGLLWVGIGWDGKQSTEIAATKPLVEKVPIESQPAIVEQKEEKGQRTVVIKKERKTKMNPQQSIETVNQENKIEEIVERQSVEIALVDPVTLAAATPSAPEQKPIVLEFRLELVETIAIAQSEEKKGPKGFFNTIKELKNGEDGLGLQAFKETLFARNFKKDKTKPEERNY